MNTILSIDVWWLAPSAMSLGCLLVLRQMLGKAKNFCGGYVFSGADLFLFSLWFSEIPLALIVRWLKR